MLKFLKTIGLALSILIGLFFLIQLIPASSIEISSEIKESERKKEVTIFKTLTSLVSTGKNKSTEKNILVLGRPGKGYSGGNLTDTIILVHLESVEKKATLISLPRDLLVEISYQKGLTKINSLYNLVGIEGLKEKIEEITDLSVDHHILVDLTVVKEIIGLVDGINVYVPQDINDPYFPGPNYTYQTFILKAGWRYLDSQTALKYIRTRYTSPNGDFDRMARQQQIIRLLKQKVLTLNPLWNFPTYLKIFNTLKSHIQTDLGLIEMKSFYQTAQEIEIDQITHLVIDKKRTDLLIGGQVMLGQQLASVVYPKTGQGNYSEIKEYIQKTINRE
ncbi:MAG: LCP family protein [Candidatus Portnoybacteria bacterium]|nr:LCP family protein [Candidatus Portnoybacteria bacterium]